MKAHEVKALREAKGCSMTEAVSHLKNRDLQRRIKNGSLQGASALQGRVDMTRLELRVHILESVCANLIDKAYPKLT